VKRSIDFYVISLSVCILLVFALFFLYHVVGIFNKSLQTVAYVKDFSEIYGIYKIFLGFIGQVYEMNKMQSSRSTHVELFVFPITT